LPAPNPIEVIVRTYLATRAFGAPNVPGHWLRLSTWLFSLAICLVACGGSEPSERAPDADAGTPGIDADAGTPDGATFDPDVGFVAAPAAPLRIEATASCRVDEDCAQALHCFGGVCGALCGDDLACVGGETCTPRGRCVSSQKDGEGETLRLDVRVVSGPGRLQRLSDDATAFRVELELAGDDLAELGTLTYRINDGLNQNASDELRRSEILDGRTTLEIPLDASAFEGDIDRLEPVDVYTDAGTVRMTVGLKQPLAGLYSGTVYVAQLGGLALPIVYGLRTEPVNASLDEANSAWVVLPVGSEYLLTTSPTGADAFVERPLEYDALTERWVARFEAPFVFGDDSPFARTDDDPIVRSLRLQLSVGADGAVFGEFADRWSGLYDAQTSLGVLSPGVATFDGTFESTRSDGLDELGSIAAFTNGSPSAQLRPLPSLDACEGLDLFGSAGSFTSFAAESGTWSCGSHDGTVGIDSLVAFEAGLDPSTGVQRAGCALAISEQALDAGGVGARILSYLDGSPPDGRSFSDFMVACATGTDSTCLASAEVTCGRQLLAYAYAQEEDDVAAPDALLDAYQRATREAFLGRQLGAFQTDVDTRLTWLRSSDFPAFLAAGLREFTTQLVDRWVEDVVDVQIEVVTELYDASNLSVLTRQPVGERAIASRQELLLEMTQAWRQATDGLMLAARRWNEVVIGGQERDEAAAAVASRALDLYVVAGIGYELNLRAGAGFQNATFSGGFGALHRELGALSLAFDELIYARDASIVVSQSLDPASDNFTLLADLRDAAFQSLEQADAAVTTVIAEANEDAVSRELLANRLSNSIDENVDDLIDLCGVPVGCEASEVGERSGCDVPVEAGECGFFVQTDGAIAGFDPSAAAPSVAGGQALRVLEALQGVDIALAEYESHEQRTDLAWAAVGAFAANVDAWNTRRLAVLDEIDATVAARSAEWTTEVESVQANMSERNQLRRELAQDATADAQTWNQLNMADGSIRSADLLGATASDGIAIAADVRAGMAESGAFREMDSMPAITGQVTDPSFAQRGALLLSARMVSRASRVAVAGATIGAEWLRSSVASERLLRAAQLSQLQDQDIGDDAEIEADIAALVEAAEVAALTRDVSNWGIEQLIEAETRLRSAELAYARDLIDLRDRRDEAYALVVEKAALNVHLVQAMLAVEQRMLEYLRTVQAANVLSSRVDSLLVQEAAVNSLVGSPSVVFSWAGRLDQAERRLDVAKNTLMDWLVGMEYFAVRPFMDQRIQILLARNTTQLEAIAADMDRLQLACGGATNLASTVVSLSEQLSLDDSVERPDSGVLGAGERFREVLGRGEVSADRRVRYSAELTGADLNARTDLLSVSFGFNLDEFANLAASCNARFVAVEVALIGEGLGDARPVVSVINTDRSLLRSCQPNLDEYVAQFGPGATAFGPTTEFRTPLRSVSPIAELGGFASEPDPERGNRSMSGLPLAGEYMVVIDPSAGENVNIDWRSVDDVLLRLTYSYQDFFSVGACE
jgi:hypothetical protein